MPCTRQAIASRPSVPIAFIKRLAVAGETYNHVAFLDAGIVDDVLSAHATDHGRIHNDRAHKVTNIGGLASGAPDIQAPTAPFFHQRFRALNERRNHIAWHEPLVASNGRTHQNGTGRANAQQIVNVHDEGILGDALPDGQIARLLPINPSQGALGARAIGVHHQAMFLTSRERIRHHFAECLGKQAFVQTSNGRMHLLFARGHSAFGIPPLHGPFQCGIRHSGTKSKLVMRNTVRRFIWCAASRSSSVARAAMSASLINGIFSPRPVG